MIVRVFVTLLFLYFCTNAIEIRVNRDIRSPFVALPRYGILKGSVGKTTWSKRLIYQFLGVRYAQSPSGIHRFKAPVPVEPWTGIRNVTNFGRKCPTLTDLSNMRENYRNAIDHEDCLNMAIYSPNLTGSLPVMVYVHGGSFYLSSASEFPSNYLLERDIVLVVVQYRLDALGFLSTNSDEMPGNAGVMDVQLALHFVKENIAHFGGNPKSVTLFGQSAGAVIVSALTISPSVPHNLFHRVIIQSGSVFSKWSVTNDPVGDARKIAKFAGLNSTQSITSLNKSFLKMRVFDLLKAVDRYQKDMSSGPLNLGARSLSIGGPDNLLPDLPHKIVSSPEYNKSIPMIVGTTKDDGSYAATIIYEFLQGYIKASGSSPSEIPIIPVFIEMLCDYLNAGDKCKTIEGIVSETFWTEEELASNEFAKIAPGLIDLLGMFLFKGPALHLALSNSKYNTNNTFVYTFDYAGKKTRFGYGKDPSKFPFKGGVTHSDDLIYLFPYPQSVTNLNKPDTLMSHKLLDLWTSFAANDRPQNVKCSWVPIIAESFEPYARIDKNISIEKEYPKEFVRNVSEKKETDFWPLVQIMFN